MDKIFILRYYKSYKFNLHVKTKKWTNIKIILHTIFHNSDMFRFVLIILRRYRHIIEEVKVKVSHNRPRWPKGVRLG
jgi:hypothetical protein